MGKTKKTVLMLLLTLILAGGITLSLALKAGKLASKRLGIGDMEITKEGISLKEIHLSEDDPAKNFKWDLHAKEVNANRERNSFQFRDYVLSLDSQRHGKIDIRGPNGNYLRDERVFELKGEISIESLRGYMAKAKDVRFEEKKGLISSHGGLMVFGDSIMLTGDSFQFDVGKGHLRMEREIKAVFKAVKT